MVENEGKLKRCVIIDIHKHVRQKKENVKQFPQCTLYGGNKYLI